jgi:hypothetical protein
MSRIRADQILNGAGTGAPNFAQGLTATTGTFSGKVSIGGTLTYEDVTNIDSVGVVTARSGVHVTGVGASVGIGTDNPTKQITVGAAITTALFEVSPHANGFDINVSSGDFAPHYQRQFVIYNGQPGSGTGRLRITAEGRTTTPYQPHFTAVGHTGWVNLAPGDKVEFQDLSSNANLNNSNRSGGYNTTNSRFTAPVDGLYRFTVHMYFNSTNAGNICSILPRVNGAQVNPGDVYFFFSVGGFSGDISANGSTCLYLSADDYVEVYKRDNNTGTNSYYSQHCWFQGQLVG